MIMVLVVAGIMAVTVAVAMLYMKRADARAQAAADELRAEVARLRRDRDAAARRTRRAREAADGFAHELDGMRRRLEVVERKHADAATAASEGELELARVERRLKAATARLEADGAG